VRALFTSRNLIGDTLYVEPALSVWAKEHPGWDIDLLTLNDHITCLYEGMNIPGLRVVFEPEPPYDFEFEFHVGKAFTFGEQFHWHIAKCYSAGLGTTIPDNPRVTYIPPEGENEKDLVLLSMFSNSCASRQGKPPNKMLNWATWLPILILARQMGRVGVLGGPLDETPLTLMKEELFLGQPLPKIARMMRDAKLLITIDNGMGHLAATQGTPTILFYPTCLGRHWIIPTGNPNLLVLHMDPVKLSTSDAMDAVRKGVKQLWRYE
jgi:hypothetical protein